MRVLLRGRIPLTAVLLAAATACGDSTTEPGGESEVISRVTLTLTPTTGSAQSVSITDPDGNGPTAPQPQSAALLLAPNTTYTGTVRFENTLTTPVEDITAEVRAEANEHRVFFTTTGTGVTINTTDTDAQSRPLGLQFSAVVGASPTSGSIRVVLCHYDGVAKPATATACTSETDINVAFNYSVPMN
jgi:hypothetical protein